MNLELVIRDVPNFPKQGIIFKDITPVLSNPEAFQHLVQQMIEKSEAIHVDKIVGIESRGFILGAAMAYELGIGFCPIRKKGKLPWKTRSVKYALEYGHDEVEIHEDGIVSGEKVLIVDDLMATGGTAAASVELVETLGGEVQALSVFIELAFLQGYKKLSKIPVIPLLKY